MESVQKQLDNFEDVRVIYFKKSSHTVFDAVFIKKNLLHYERTEACLVKALLLTFEQSGSREGGIDSTYVIRLIIYILMFVINHVFMF